MKLRRRIFLGVILPEKDFGQDSNFKMVLYSLPDMDAIYPKVIAEESPLTIAKMAYLRVTDADRCTGRCEETL